MNGWLLVRIAGIVVGIATLLRVATNEGLVNYDPLFLAWMDWLSDIVELGFLTKLIGPFLHWGIDQVRSLGISVPDLQDEWRPGFVLSSLMFAAVARHSRSGWGVAAAPVGALAIAVWAGLEGSHNPIGAAAFGTSFFLAADSVAIFFALALTVAVGVGVHAVGASVAAFAASLVAVAAVLLLAASIRADWAGGWRAVFASKNFNIGIDILFTMSFAFLIAVAAANPPIW